MLGEVETVRMDQVDPLFGERLRDCFALPPFDRGARAVGDVRQQRCGRDQAAATGDPSGATTRDVCPAAARARSSAERTCSAPPTASGPTGASA